MRQFYLAYPISAEAPHQLSWTHIVEILKIDNPLERSFYEEIILFCHKYVINLWQNIISQLCKVPIMK